jgi:gluconate 2-dehydrogenase gamma chain
MNRREFLKLGAAGAIGFGVASAIEIPLLENQINLQTGKNENQQSQINEGRGFLTLNADEQPLVEALAETIFPSDSNGPGAKEAGVIYFIDNMLAGNYGQASNKWWFMQGPFIQPQPAGTKLTVMGAVYPSTTKTAITYTNGTIQPRLQAGTAYQYLFNPREFWRRGLMYLQSYCQAAKGRKFETLSSDVQLTVLKEMFENSPSNTALQSAFQGPNAAEFFNEIHDMVTAGYWTDPLYGGNIGKVGWNLLAFAGLNQGTTEGYTTIELATMSTPVRLSPLSLGDVQKGATM